MRGRKLLTSHLQAHCSWSSWQLIMAILQAAISHGNAVAANQLAEHQGAHEHDVVSDSQLVTSEHLDVGLANALASASFLV